VEWISSSLGKAEADGVGGTWSHRKRGAEKMNGWVKLAKMVPRTDGISISTKNTLKWFQCLESLAVLVAGTKIDVKTSLISVNGV